jgi:hypothetical protein
MVNPVNNDILMNCQNGIVRSKTIAAKSDIDTIKITITICSRAKDEFRHFSCFLNLSKKRPIFSLDLLKTLFLPLLRDNVSGGSLIVLVMNSLSYFCDSTVVNLIFMIEIQKKALLSILYFQFCWLIHILRLIKI